MPSCFISKWKGTSSENEVEPKDTKCRLDIIKLLLENGADVNVVNSQGYTALHYACIICDRSVVLLLVNASCDSKS